MYSIIKRYSEIRLQLSSPAQQKQFKALVRFGFSDIKVIYDDDEEEEEEEDEDEEEEDE